MSTTTDRPRVRRGRAAARFVAASAGVLLAWGGALAAAARWIEPTREVLVAVPADRVASLLSVAPVLALDAPAGLLRVRGEAPGFVRALYAAGAIVVLPAPGPGCRGAFGPRAAAGVPAARTAPGRDP